MHSNFPHGASAPRAGVLAFGLLFLFLGTAAQSQQTPSAPNPFVEELRQQERERALREQMERGADTRLQVEAPAVTKRLPTEEAPCLRIDRVVLDGELSQQFQWLLPAAAGAEGDDSPIGRCLGTEGVNTVMARLQQAAIARGYITTRVLAAPQDLSQGTLTLTLVPGRIAAIRLAEGSDTHVRLWNAIPAGTGDLLNLRDIEQGLDNLKRVPTAEADIQIEPSTAPNARPGDSDLVVKYSQPQRLRLALSLDDSGTESTGRYQGGATVSGDNLLGLNDLLYVNAGHSIDGHGVSNPKHATENQTAHYSVPYGHWLLGLTASNSRYRQSVAGAYQDYVYAGKSNSAELKLSRLVYRDQQRKTTVSLRAVRRESRNFIDDTEVGVQHRVTGAWEASVNHKEYLGQATLEANLGWRHGTGGFGARRAPEEEFDEGTSRFKIITADVNLQVPFQMAGQRLRYNGLWRAQWSRTPLTPQERFGIGGRYTVRGFDGESTLLADGGWLVRNDIGWALGALGAELYLGLDYGHVSSRWSGRYLIGHELAGGVIGLRGAWRSLSYDVFVGAPIRKPEGFQTARVAAGFSLNYAF